MFEPAQLAGFVAAVAVLIVVPGPATMIIIAHALTGQRRIALAAVAGVESGTIVHTLAAAAGLSAVLAASPLALVIVQYCGAAYLVVEGARMFAGHAGPLTAASELSAVAAYRRSFVTNVLNPKTALFFLAFLPQFVNPQRGRLFVQFLILGALVSLVGIAVGSVYALSAGSMAESFRRLAGAGRWQQRLAGGVLIAIAVRIMSVPPA
jgi:threonine/homoserine/homoserine lactone efflux protein